MLWVQDSLCPVSPGVAVGPIPHWRKGHAHLFHTTGQGQALGSTLSCYRAVKYPVEHLNHLSPQTA